MKNMPLKILTSSFLFFSSPSVIADAIATDVTCTGCVGASDISKNAITGQKIKNRSIKNSDLAKGAVTSATVRDGSITAYDLSRDAVDSVIIKDGSITEADLSNDSVSSAMIKDGSVTETDLSSSLMSMIESMQARIHELEQREQALSSLLDYFKVENIIDPNTAAAYPTIKIVGANLQIVNGLGEDGFDQNGVGNLIVGYNKLNDSTSDSYASCSVPNSGTSSESNCLSRGGVWSANHRNGSHNLIVGAYNSYSNNAGIIAGKYNASNSPGGSVYGGERNRVGSSWSSISGGSNNETKGLYSSILGGVGNETWGQGATVSGGGSNKARGQKSSVSGGSHNEARGGWSSVSGGYSRDALNDRNWRAGSLLENL